jgi:hypothetical protein
MHLRGGSGLERVPRRGARLARVEQHSNFTRPGSLGIWNVVKKVADQTKTANITIANDTELSFAMAPSTKYQVRGTILFDTGATGDFKWRHVGPASPTLVRLFRQWIIPGTAVFAGMTVDTAFSAADLALAGAGTTGGLIQLEGAVHNGLNAGNFAFAWAQNTSDATATIVRAGSYLEWMQVA